MGLKEDLIADFKTEAAITRKHLSAVPAEHFAWKPHAKSMSLIELAGHLAENPTWVMGMYDEDLDIDRMMSEWKPYVPKTRDELVAFFDENTNAFLAKVEAGTEDRLRSEWKMIQGGKTLMKSPRHAAIRSTGLHHMIHHRGQLTVYFRLLGVPVPGSYGPSADEPWNP